MNRKKSSSAIFLTGIFIIIWTAINMSSIAAADKKTAANADPIQPVNIATSYDVKSINNYKLLRSIDGIYFTGKDSKLPYGIYTEKNSKLVQIYKSNNYIMNLQHIGYSKFTYFQLNNVKAVYSINSATGKIVRLQGTSYYGKQYDYPYTNPLICVTDYKTAVVYSNVDGTEVCKIAYVNGYQFYRKIGNKVIYKDNKSSKDTVLKPQYKIYDLKSKKLSTIDLIYENYSGQPVLSSSAKVEAPQLLYVLNGSFTYYSSQKDKDIILCNIKKGESLKNYITGVDYSQYTSSSYNNWGSYTSTFIIQNSKQKRFYFFDIKTGKIRLVLTENTNFNYLPEALSNKYLMLDKDGNHHIVLNLATGDKFYMHMLSNSSYGRLPILDRMIYGINDKTNKMFVLNTCTGKYAEFSEDKAPVNNKNYSISDVWTVESKTSETGTDITIKFNNKQKGNFYVIHIDSDTMRLTSENTDK